MYYCVQQNELGSFSVAACNLLNSGLFTSAKKKCRGDFTVLKFPSASPQHYFCRGLLDLKLRLSTLTCILGKLTKKIPYWKLSSEASPITNFSFYLTFAMKYHFDCMRCRHLGCTSYVYRLFAIKTYIYL